MHVSSRQSHPHETSISGEKERVAEKYPFLIPYLSHIGEKYSAWLMEAAIMCEKVWEIFEFLPGEIEIIQIATYLTDIGKYGNHIFQENSNTALRWLYLFDTVFTPEQKNKTLSEFIEWDLIRWLAKKDIFIDKAHIKSYFDTLHSEQIFEEYKNDYAIDYKNITLAQAWSLYHVLSGEGIWQKLAHTYPHIIQSTHIDLARLHHLSEWIHLKKRDDMLENDIRNEKAKLITSMILIDKVQAFRSRTDIIDTSIRYEYLNLSEQKKSTLGIKIVEVYDTYKDRITDVYLKRKNPDRRASIFQNIAQMTKMNVKEIFMPVEEIPERRISMQRRW